MMGLGWTFMLIIIIIINLMFCIMFYTFTWNSTPKILDKIRLRYFVFISCGASVGCQQCDLFFTLWPLKHLCMIWKTMTWTPWWLIWWQISVPRKKSFPQKEMRLRGQLQLPQYPSSLRIILASKHQLTPLDLQLPPTPMHVRPHLPPPNHQK